jgi:hypothetical protein
MFTVKLNRLCSAVGIVLLIDLVVFDQRLLIDDPSHSMGPWIDSDCGVKPDTFEINLRVVNITETLLGGMSRKHDTSSVVSEIIKSSSDRLTLNYCCWL